ncbi:MAG: AAA family ATPase [Chloroflexi bacterium]|nr:AAA family ATPase [Chloroflexota bacterium]
MSGHPKWSDVEYAAPPGEIVALPTTGSGIPYRTPLQIAASTSEHPDWLIRGYVALGAITELDGKIKSSGKTTLALEAVRSILDGQPFLGQPTMTTKVVYLTEQTPGPFREALGRAGLLGRGDELRVVFRGDVAARPWSELIRDVVDDALRDGYGLLVVDTLGKLAQVKEENDAGEGGRVMAPLQDAAHAGLAVLVCRHERKGGGDVGESGRGSSAISGDVDVILQLRRAEGNVPRSRRVIETLSRYTETPEKVVIELTDEGYVLRGEEEAVALNDAIRFVSALLGREIEQKRIEGAAPSLDEMVRELELPRAAIQRALRELERRGDVTRSGEGKRGSPYRYSLAETVSAQTHGLYGQKRIGNGLDALSARYLASIGEGGE